MVWNMVTSQNDADTLMERFGGFHDACIREAHFWTDQWVSSSLSMSCSEGLDTRIRFHIQRQCADPGAIELLFEEVTRFNFVPTPKGYDAIIFKATLIVRSGDVFWSPDACWRPDMPERDSLTWISAKQLRWREVDWLGKTLQYGPHDEL